MSKIYMNRELSWLKFNERVLEEAENPEVPLCERLTFASIYQSNLDEFFMVRVGSLYDQTLLDKKICENKTGMTSQEQIDAILKQTKLINKRKEAVYEELMARVTEQGIRILRFNELDEDGARYLEGYFKSEIAPIISPTVIGRRQPFPFLKNKEIYAVAVLGAKGKKDRLGIIPCTSNIFGRLIAVPGMPGTYMLAEELILHFAPVVFKGYKIKSKSLLRITRNADIDADALYDEDLDYREFMAGLIKQRKKLAPIRLELSRDMDKKGIAVLCEYLELDENHVFMSSTPLDLSFVFQIQDLLRKNPELYFPKRTPQKSDQFQDGKSIIAQIKEEDKLLSYPYESIRPFLHLLTEAAEDPDVISINHTNKNTDADNHQSFDQIILTLRDIHEDKLKELREQQALQEAFDAAKAANMAKNEFLSRMSHDIRTPMNATASSALHDRAAPVAVYIVNLINSVLSIDCSLLIGFL